MAEASFSMIISLTVLSCLACCVVANSTGSDDTELSTWEDIEFFNGDTSVDRITKQRQMFTDNNPRSKSTSDRELITRTLRNILTQLSQRNYFLENQQQQQQDDNPHLTNYQEFPVKRADNDKELARREILRRLGYNGRRVEIPVGLRF